MESIVRAVDVGFGNTKYVTGATGADIRCSVFPSVAYPSARDLSAVPIDGLFYEVGPEVNLAADTFRATQMHDRYTETPEYLALLRGALNQMKVPAIDLLVVGLPVAAFLAKKAALEKAMTGRHEVGGGQTVTVRKALAVAQPQGALVYYASLHEKLKTIEHEQSLIIDPGARTFDWLVAKGMRLVQKKSHSINRGMADVLQAIATEISEDIGTSYRDFDAIDVALRTGKSPMIYQKPYDMTRLMPIARTIAQQAVSSMMQWIEASYSFQNIILVGGGAFLFKKAVKEAFPKHKIHEIKDPMYANVKGFQIAGMNYATSILAKEGQFHSTGATAGGAA
ncbi:PRTRC system protein D [Noviherbaspirillum sedimenti]|uniref:PRTRC system protein D n=1 Tax=Noviherbaspirillum sedimenti TaxID=2320865 RepID=A0A3A3FWS5_9BURK|nr:PRTRC system protein D [Noviherbaspirillum sedimenti]RJG00597.1 PRTRC system protein D [Noviherbaspirillum sedimenti]